MPVIPVTIDVQVLERTIQTIPEAFRNPAPTRSAAVTPANSPAQIAQPRPPATSSALGFPRPASDLSAIRNTVTSNRAYHSAAYRAGQIARGGVELGKGIGKGILLNQIEQAAQGAMDAGFDNWVDTDRRQDRFEKPAWDMNARTDSRTYNEFYEAQQRAIDQRNEARQLINQQAEEFSREASKAWENAKDAARELVDGLTEAARDMKEQLEREIDERRPKEEEKEPGQREDDFGIQIHPEPLAPTEDRAREENPLPNPDEPSPEPNLDIDPGDPEEDISPIPDPDPTTEPSTSSSKEVTSSEEASGFTCEGWALIRVDRLIIFKRAFTRQGEPYSFSSTSIFKQFYWVLGADGSSRRTISYLSSFTGNSPPLSSTSKNTIIGIKAAAYIIASSGSPDPPQPTTPIGTIRSTNNYFDPDQNGYWWDPFSISPRHGYYSASKAYLNIADNPGWVDNYRESTHQSVAVVMISCTTGGGGSRSGIEIRKREMKNCCSCDSIRAMLKSLRQTLLIPIVSCELDEETQEWKPKIEEKRIEIFTLDEKTALGMAELYKNQAEIALMQCEAKNGAGEEAIALIPEHWQVRVGADRPQLSVAYGEVENGKVGRGRWPVTIPHYRHGPGVTPNFPSYTKGNFWARLILRDNSRILINAVSVAEAKRVVTTLKGFVKPSLVDPNQKIVTGERPAEASVGVRRVSPVFAAFFPKGQQEPPEWHLNLRK